MSLPTLVTATATIVRGPPTHIARRRHLHVHRRAKPPSPIFITRASGSALDARAGLLPGLLDLTLAIIPKVRGLVAKLRLSDRYLADQPRDSDRHIRQSGSRARVSWVVSVSALRCAVVPAVRERHRPEETLLYQVVHEHWPAFRALADEQGGLPGFVTRDFEEYLRCGLLELRAAGTRWWWRSRASGAGSARRAAGGA